MRLFLFFLCISTSVYGKIYDAFTFFNELELLAIRLEELDSIVDHFVLVEGTLTFTGAPKPLYFFENRHRFEPYLHKIIHVVVDDFPIVDNRLPLREQPWVREAHQRNALLRGLTSATDKDIVMITDVDEIPRKEAILSAQSLIATHRRSLIVALEMSLFRFQLNRLDAKIAPWKLGFVTSKKMLRRELPHSIRLSQKPDRSIASAGWHFTSQGGAENVVYKMESYSHAFESDNRMQRERVMQEFDSVLAPFIVVPIDDTWPLRIQRMAAEYEAMGWIAR